MNHAVRVRFIKLTSSRTPHCPKRMWVAAGFSEVRCCRATVGEEAVGGRFGRARPKTEEQLFFTAIATDRPAATIHSQQLTKPFSFLLCLSCFLSTTPCASSHHGHYLQDVHGLQNPDPRLLGVGEKRKPRPSVQLCSSHDITAKPGSHPLPAVPVVPASRTLSAGPLMPLVSLPSLLYSC
jgi:hypothetical protein